MKFEFFDLYPRLVKLSLSRGRSFRATLRIVCDELRVWSMEALASNIKVLVIILSGLTAPVWYPVVRVWQCCIRPFIVCVREPDRARRILANNEKPRANDAE